MRYVSGCVLAVCLAVPVAEAAREEKPLTPAEAIKMVNKEVTLEMRVRSSKNALAQRHEIYLDSEENFRDEKNLAVVITEEGAGKFKEAPAAPGQKAETFVKTGPDVGRNDPCTCGSGKKYKKCCALKA